MTVHRVMRFVLISAACSTPALLSAQGFGLNEISSCGIGRGFAVSASPCADASTIFWNPAAATSLTGWNVTAGASVIAIKGSFQQDTTFRRWDADEPTKIVPHLFLNYHGAGSNLAWGIGAYVPYGLTSQWTQDFPGRFAAQKAALQTIYVQPNVAWQINKTWSVGGGPIWGHSNVELDQSVDLSSQLLPTGSTFAQIGVANPTEFARAHLKGSANAFGVQLGVSGHFANNWSVGARFLSPLEFKYDNADATFEQVPTNLIVGGTLPGPTQATTIPAGTPIDVLVAPQFQSGGALVAQKASTKITHPAQVQAGVSYSGYRNWLLEADYAFVGWKRFDVLPVTFLGPAQNSASRVLIEQYNNSSAIRLGAQYTIPSEGWQLRAGFAGVASAAPPETVTPLLPEQDRTYWTVGAGIPFGKTWALDASYARVATPGSRGRIVERTSTSQTAAQLNTGVYHLSGNIFAFTIKANF